MTTIDQLNDETEIRAIQGKIDDWQTRVIELLKTDLEELTPEQKIAVAAKIKYYSDWISENNKIIMIAKEKAVAKEIEKAKQITLDKQYRL